MSVREGRGDDPTVGAPPKHTHDGPATAYARIHSPKYIAVNTPLFAQMATPGGYINFLVESY